MNQKPKEWRGAFVHALDGEMVLMSTEGHIYRAKTPEELWAHIEDLTQATSHRALDFTQVGNLAPKRRQAQDRRTARQAKAKAQACSKTLPADQLTIDDLLGEAPSIDDLLGDLDGPGQPS